MTDFEDCAFFQHFASVWKERWPDLCDALQKRPSLVARINAFSTPEILREALCIAGIEQPRREESDLEAETLLQGLERDFYVASLPPERDLFASYAKKVGCSLPSCISLAPRDDLDEDVVAEGGFLPADTVSERLDPEVQPYYLMDLASVVAAALLQVRAGHRVADLCAAPGGKTLVLLEALLNKTMGNWEADEDHDGLIHANDFSPDRNDRLGNVFASYVPERNRSRVSVTRVDATRWQDHDALSYDRVLVDAPCSSERHVLQKGGEQLQSWNLNTSRANAARQVQLLKYALRAVKPGGLVVYSTCSISKLENDDVVRKALASSKDESSCRVVSAKELPGWVQAYIRACLPGAWRERTRYGWWCLPDANNNFGPLFFTLIYKEM